MKITLKTCCLIVQSLLLTWPLSARSDSTLPVNNFVSFYPKAYAVTQTPHPPGEMQIVCQKPSKLGGHLLSFLFGGYVTLLSDKSGKILIAAYSKQPDNDPKLINDPRHNPRYLDWAFVWDRNGDGQIDYIAALEGADLVVTSGDLPLDFPKGRRPQLTTAQVQWTMTNVKVTNYHLADDNFDGKADVAIYPYRDMETPMWVKGFAVLRSSHFDDVIDETWLFRERIEEHLGPVPRNEKGFRIAIDPDVGVPASKVMPQWTDMFADFNHAVQECGVGPLLPHE